MFQKNVMSIIKQITYLVDTCKEDLFVVNGGIKSGKSYILSLLQNEFTREPYSVLYLGKHVRAYQHMEYGAFVVSLSNVEYKNRVKKSGIKNAISIFSESTANFIEFLGNLENYILEHKFFNLNSAEIEIIKRIYSICDNERLILLADDLDKWDKESTELLRKVILLKDISDFSVFNNMVLICAQTKEKMEIIEEKFVPYYIEKVDYTEFQNLISNTTISALSYGTQKQIFEITDGNYGLMRDIIDFSLTLHNEYIDESIFEQSRFESVFKSIIHKRLEALDDAELRMLLESATLMGEIFNSNLLTYLLNKKEYQIKRLLYTAKNEHFIYEIKDKWKFSAEYIYDYFLECVDSRAPEVQYDMARIYEKYMPSDIYSRYHHLKGAGLERNAVNMLTVYCIRKIVAGKYYKKANEDIIVNYSENYDVLKAIQSIDFSSEKKSDYYKGKNTIAASEDFLDEIVLSEKIYVLALVLYRCDNLEFTKEAQLLLEDVIQQEEMDIYQWSKAALLLIIIYINRLEMYNDAKLLERKLVLKLSKYEKIDTGLKIISSTLQRISPALYNSDIAFLKLKKCYNYFETNKMIYPKDYIMAATNYMAVCICNSKYHLATEIGESAYAFLSTHFTMDFPKIYKFFNNLLIAKLLFEKKSAEECLSEYQKLFKLKPEYKSQRLLNNNFAVILAYIDIRAAEIIIKKLYIDNNLSKHNDYYTYLFTINLMVIHILKNEYDDANELFSQLENLVPTICRNDRSFLIQRYSAYQQILSTRKIYKHIDTLELEFQQYLDLDSYWKNLFILSDCQYWTEF